MRPESCSRVTTGAGSDVLLVTGTLARVYSQAVSVKMLPGRTCFCGGQFPFRFAAPMGEPVFSRLLLPVQSRFLFPETAKIEHFVHANNPVLIALWLFPEGVDGDDFAGLA